MFNTASDIASLFFTIVFSFFSQLLKRFQLLSRSRQKNAIGMFRKRRASIARKPKKGQVQDSNYYQKKALFIQFPTQKNNVNVTLLRFMRVI